jgi:hypothetical protein
MMQNDGAGFLSGAAGGFFGTLGATAWGGAGGEWKGIGGKYAGSSVGTIAFGALSGGVGAELSGGNFWQGAIAGGIVSALNHSFHKTESSNMFDDDQSGDEVTKQSLGIKKGDTPEVMISKMMKGMKVGDYMDGSQLDFLNKDAGILIDKIYRTSGTTFKVDRTFLAGRAALNDQASLTIVKGTLQKMDGYNYKINGFRSTTISNKIVTNGFINDNRSYYYQNNKLVYVPVIK